MLDPFQIEAIEALENDRSVMVAAPTGTGKTVIAEFGIFRAWERGLRSVYTAPIKALSNQKFRDFRDQYGDAVGLLTGDIVENPQGQILVMTTEVLRNMLVQRPEVIEDVGCVIFDEIHYLADPERGTAWEESIILCPPHVQLVCLSATVSNAPELADWITAVHRPIDLVFHTERSVPLEQYYFFQHRLHKVVDAAGRQTADFRGVGGEARRSGVRFRRGSGSGAGGRRMTEVDERFRETEPPDVVRGLKKEGLLPAIYFVFSRKDTERVAGEIATVGLVDNRTRAEIMTRAEYRLRQLAPEDRRLEQVQNLEHALTSGVAYHHAGLLPLLKVLVEELFSSGLLPVVVATDTLALGVNMPAKTVVIGELTKFDGESRRLLIPNEYQQMTGRAGRRGLDPRGAAVVPYSPWVGFDEWISVARGTLHPVRSGFAIRYNTLLNLWTTFGEDQIVSLFSNSLREFQVDAHLRSLQTELQQVDAQIASGRSGCLIGEEDTLERYDADRKALQNARKELKRAEERVERAVQRIEGMSSFGPQWAEQQTALEQAFGPELDAVRRDAAEAAARVDDLKRRLDESHCQSCPERKRHQEQLVALSELEADRRAVVQELRKVREEKENRTRQIVERLLSVLGAFGYIRRGRLTDKARVLKDVFDPNGLIICESIERGLLEHLSAPELVEVLSWFAYDRDISFANRLDLPSRVWDVRRQLDRLQQQVFRTESDLDVFLTRGASPYFFGVAHWWCRGWTFERLLDSVNLTEGDIVMTLNKTLDLMRQVTSALRHSGQASKLVDRLEEGERLIRRGIVEQCFSAMSPTGHIAPVDEDAIEEVPVHLTPAAAQPALPSPVETGKRRRTRRRAPPQA